MRIRYGLFLGIMLGVFNLIPYFGSIFACVIAVVITIFTGGVPKAIWTAVALLIVQQIDGNIIGPKIIGNSTGLSAFWVVFSILLGGGLFGIPGMILGVPTFAVLSYIVTMLINHNLEKKNLPTEASCYDELSYVDTDGTYVHSDRNEFKK